MQINLPWFKLLLISQLWIGAKIHQAAQSQFSIRICTTWYLKSLKRLKIKLFQLWWISAQASPPSSRRGCWGWPLNPLAVDCRVQGLVSKHPPASGCRWKERNKTSYKNYGRRGVSIGCKIYIEWFRWGCKNITVQTKWLNTQKRWYNVKSSRGR